MQWEGRLCSAEGGIVSNLDLDLDLKLLFRFGKFA